MSGDWSEASDILILETNVADRATADRIAEALIAPGHAACANIYGPMRSVYRWKGAVEREEEWTVIFKLSADRRDAAVAALRAAHPYETPCIMALPLAGAARDYAAWVRAGGA